MLLLCFEILHKISTALGIKSKIPPLAYKTFSISYPTTLAHSAAAHWPPGCAPYTVWTCLRALSLAVCSTWKVLPPDIPMVHYFTSLIPWRGLPRHTYYKMAFLSISTYFAF